MSDLSSHPFASSIRVLNGSDSQINIDDSNLFGAEMASKSLIARMDDADGWDREVEQGAVG